jgi:hypothetical protein
MSLEVLSGCLKLKALGKYKTVTEYPETKVLRKGDTVEC